MFIELTDHLRCPAPHEERFLVLLPDRMEGRRVIAGTLGCPVCSRVVTLRDGVVDFGRGSPAAAPTKIPAEAVPALLAIQGPGGFVALLGSAGALVAPLAEALPGVHFALVNPPEGISGSPAASVLWAERLPLKAGSMRGVVVGRSLGDDPSWIDAAIAAALPGNRVVVEGSPADPAGVEVLARADGVWVARVLSRRGA